MKTKSKYLILFSVLATGLITACEKENDNLEMAEIHGEVEYNDTPYQGATINLHSGINPIDPFEGYTSQATTDVDGKFDFDGLAKGEYYVFAFIVDDHDTLSGSDIIIINTEKGTYEVDIHIESDDHVD